MYTGTMAATMKYNLQQITDLSFSGFTFEIPEDACNMINYLCTQVGSSGLISPTFKKTETVKEPEGDHTASTGFKNNNKKRKGNKGMEISADEWESIRTFQATKIENKDGIDGDIDQIRLYLNKLTDKTFLDLREKIVDKINKICSESTNPEDGVKLGNMLYDLCSTNKFYSKIFADLFAELASQYVWLLNIFNQKYENIMEQYKDIQYVDSDVNYDGFCDMNKKNEKRRAMTSFLVNLGENNFIKKKNVVEILTNLLTIVCGLIELNDKKNEVDELTENIAILFNKELIEEVLDENDSDDEDKFTISDKSIIDTVNSLAKSKAKDYPSLSNKAIFKYMDLVEM
jgi:hypothetical protein